MADEQINGIAGTNGEETTSTKDVAVKKTRGPRRPKNAIGAAVNAENGIADKPAKKTRAKRGTKTAEAKAPRAPRVSNRSGSTTMLPASASPTAVDEFADLLGLEEENRSLRKQLAEKLRAENADLRKRLGQN